MTASIRGGQLEKCVTWSKSNMWGKLNMWGKSKMWVKSNMWRKSKMWVKSNMWRKSKMWVKSNMWVSGMCNGVRRRVTACTASIRGGRFEKNSLSVEVGSLTGTFRFVGRLSYDH